MSEILKNVEDKLKCNLDSSEKGIIGILLSLQNTLLKSALQIEQFIGHDNPTDIDVSNAISAIVEKIEEIEFSQDSIDPIICNLQKAISILEEKREVV